jgi:hypothetical protein
MGQPERAVRLWGAAEALYDSIGKHTDYYDRAAARAQLDDATFAAAWAEGRAMTVEQAIAYALADDTKC